MGKEGGRQGEGAVREEGEGEWEAGGRGKVKRQEGEAGREGWAVEGGKLAGSNPAITCSLHGYDVTEALTENLYTRSRHSDQSLVCQTL